ncbi:MAG: YopX family protein, partial [Smithella sp.]
MREIKFRVWDTKYNEWSSCGLAAYREGKIPIREVVASADHPLIIMQFTGLHDRQGKEIFEGDVVAIMGSDCSKCPSKDENGDCALTDESCPVVEKHRDVVTMERFPLYWLK